MAIWRDSKYRERTLAVPNGFRGDEIIFDDICTSQFPSTLDLHDDIELDRADYHYIDHNREIGSTEGFSL